MATRAQVNPFFSPTQISGCTLWLDAADRTTISLSGQNITQWRDKSSSGFVFNGSVGTYPTYTSTLNSLPVISSATGQKLTTTLWNQNFSGGLATFFFVIRPTQNVVVDYQGYPIFRRVTGTGTFQLDITYANQGGYYYYLQVWTNNSFIFQGSLVNSPSFNPTNLPLLLTIVVNGTANNIGQYNGASTATNPLNSANTIPALSGVTIDLIGASDARNFDTAEIITFNGILNRIQYQQVEGYLAWKWGLQANLPADHPYKSSPIPPLLSPPITLPIGLQNSTVIPWSPLQISGCVVWLDAADRTTLSLSGTTVNSWTSKITTNSLLASSVGGGSILYSNYNNLPSLYFNGTNTRMTTNSISSYGTTGTTWITVSANLTPITSTTPIDSSVVIATSGSPEKSIRYQYLNQFTMYAINNGFLRGVIDENTNGIRGFLDQAASFVSYVNGSLVKNDLNPATYQAGVNQSFQLGYWNTGNLLGHIQEIIIYNSRLTISDYQTVEGYLAWKWGLQGLLPSDHPFKNSRPFGGFNGPSTLSIGIKGNWIPTRISGCYVWFDGADPNGNGNIPIQNSAITTWVNKTGGTNATAVGTGALFSSNGLTFATPKYYTTSIPYSTNYSIFIVATNTTVPQCYFFARNSIGGGRGPTFTQGYGTSTRLQFYEGDGGVFPIIAESPSDPFLTSIDYSNLSYLRTYYNGINTSNIVPTATYNSAAWDTIGQAGAGVNTGYYNGTMKELIFFNTVLSTQQRQQVEGYLAWKWGLQANLPSTHPFARWPPPP